MKHSRFAAERLGADRVVLGRELSIKEIASVAADVGDLEVEAIGLGGFIPFVFSTVRPACSQKISKRFKKLIIYILYYYIDGCHS